MSRHPGKIDLWAALLVVGALAVLVLFAAVGVWAGDAILLASGLLGALSVFAVIRLFAYPMHYEIADTGVIIQSGVQRLVIPLDHIDEVQPTRVAWSSPAWSLDRLRIDYRSPGEKPRWVLIKPADNARFMADLAGRTNLRPDGNSLR